MRVPLVRPGEKPSPIVWWEWLFAPLVMPLFFIQLILLASVRLLTLPLFNWFLWCRERQFVQQMHERGRFMPWDELQLHLQKGEGTLIVEQAQNDWIRVWWTSQDVMQDAPVQPPSERNLDYLLLASPHPFVSWCFERYLHSDSGCALLTNPQYRYPPGMVKASFFRRLFPTLRVVMTVKQRPV